MNYYDMGLMWAEKLILKPKCSQFTRYLEKKKMYLFSEITVVFSGIRFFVKDKIVKKSPIKTRSYLD